MTKTKQAKIMDRDAAYISSIPKEAVEKIKRRYADGSAQTAEYYVGKELVGSRAFYPTGELDYEYAFKNGQRHGVSYGWSSPGKLLSLEPYDNGLAHGTAYQWANDGTLLGSYEMAEGTGVDLWWQGWSNENHKLAEAYYYQDGKRHGFEWWLNPDGQTLWIERHWLEGKQHGIEREWNTKGQLRRSYPRFWLYDKRVTKARYLRAAAKDQLLPPFRPEDNTPYREFPPEVAPHLGLRTSHSQKGEPIPSDDAGSHSKTTM